MIWIETLAVIGLSWLAACCLLGLDDSHNHHSSKDGS